MPILDHLQHRRFATDTFLYGSSYYPEHWEKNIRAQDPPLFASADWNVVRMAWDRFEPEEGKYDFSLFDETVDAFWRHGVRTILCPPTAAGILYPFDRWRSDGLQLGVRHQHRQSTAPLSPYDVVD